MTRACRSRYLGATVRLRGRDATVTDCARPKSRPAPKKAVARFRVTYPSGNQRPVPRSTVYRAARCSAKPAARGCAPLDIERAPWLANRPLDTSFDFGEPADSAPAPRPRSITRAPELQGPVRLPSPALLAVMLPETRPLARWLAYAAPWSWERVAKVIADAREVDPVHARPLSAERRRQRGTHSEGYGPRSALTAASPHLSQPPFVPRRSTAGFFREVATVVEAVLAIESGVWSGTFARWEVQGAPAGTTRLWRRRPTDPETIAIPPGTHGSTAAAMRRRVAERNRADEQAWQRATKLLTDAQGIIAAWTADPSRIPSDPRALVDRGAAVSGTRSDHDLEYAETWHHDGHDWRMSISREEATVDLERYDRGAWHVVWRGRFDLRRDRIDTEGAPSEVLATLQALRTDRSLAAEWRLPRLFGGGREQRRIAALRRYESEARSVGSTACGTPLPLLAADGRDAWDLTRRIPCSAGEGQERLRRARDAELAALCEDPLSDGCEAFHELVQQGCAPTCDPRAGAKDQGQCPHQITRPVMDAWQRGEEPLPAFIYDTDRPHVVGSDACYYGPAMTARRRLHARIRRETRIPERIEKRGDGAVEEFLHDAIVEAERAWPDRAQAELWTRTDERLLGRARAKNVVHHRFGVDEIDDLAIAMLGVERGDYTAAYKVAGRFNVTSADNEIDPQGVADELWSYWKEQQKQTRGGEARITAMLKRHRNVYMAALAIAKSRAEGKKAKRR